MSEHNADDPVRVLPADQCWELLGSEQVGRLVITVNGRAEIYPVNYVVQDEALYFRSGEGSKLSELTVYPQVAFEADRIREDDAWSVVVHGRAHTLLHFDDIRAVDALGLMPWVPTSKFNYVKLTADEISGRRFRLVPHPG